MTILKKSESIASAKMASPVLTSLSVEDMENLRQLVTAAVAELAMPNTKVYHLAIYGVITVAICLVLGTLAIILLQGTSENIPEFFAVSLGAALGAIAGMLAPTPGNSG